MVQPSSSPGTRQNHLWSRPSSPAPTAALLCQIPLDQRSGDQSSIPGLGRLPGEGKGYPLQYSGLENSMDCIVHGVAESDTTERLSLTDRIRAFQLNSAAGKGAVLIMVKYVLSVISSLICKDGFLRSLPGQW